MLSGEIPQEQIDYERDSIEFQRQIAILEKQELFLLENKKLADKVMSEIQRDSNKVFQDLAIYRKELLKYGVDVEQYNQDELIIIDEKEKKAKKTLINQQGINLNKSYSLIIQTLRNRQEKSERFVLAQAINEFGNLHFSLSKLAEAEAIWNEVLDTIFQKFSSLKSFRKIFNESSNLSFQFGVKQCILACNVLNKLATISYSNILHTQRECILMASELILSIYKLSLPHPQNIIQHSSYKMKE